MKASGKMIYSTAEVLRLGQMDQGMMETMPLEESMALVPTSGMMALSTLETGKKTRSVG